MESQHQILSHLNTHTHIMKIPRRHKEEHVKKETEELTTGTPG
jgi:hypothetical protein